MSLKAITIQQAVFNDTLVVGKAYSMVFRVKPQFPFPRQNEPVDVIVTSITPDDMYVTYWNPDLGKMESGHHFSPEHLVLGKVEFNER